MKARFAAPDVLIVGAGVVGASLAYEIARRGQRVLVVDRADGAALGATRWSMGGTHWLVAATDPRLRDLCREGLDRHQAMTEELGTDSPLLLKSLERISDDLIQEMESYEDVSDVLMDLVIIKLCIKMRKKEIAEEDVQPAHVSGSTKKSLN